MSLSENRDPTEPTLDPIKGDVRADDDLDVLEGEETFFTDHEILGYLGESKRLARNYQQIAAMRDWEEAEAAYRSRHHGRSKYNKAHYKNRASYFKPKTRAAVHRNLMSTAAALFASSDVIVTEAADDTNDMQRANAELIREILNARLTNKTERTGVPWDRIVLGARVQSQTMGVTCAKVHWRYKTIEKTVQREEQRPRVTPDGFPVMDYMTGQPIVETVVVEDAVTDVLVDKPVVDLIPAEMVLMNPAADWINPIQSSPVLIVQHPMLADDVLAMMRDDAKSAVQWRPVDDADFQQAVYSENELMGLRQAREGDGAKDTAKGTKTRGLDGTGQMTGQVVDVWECFFRVDGIDYHCWSLRDKALLSEPIPTDEAYPAQRGVRPYVLGTDTIEPFVLLPESHVASWRPSQAEINDWTNIRMDANRKSVYPTAKVKAGRGVDHKAVMRQDAMGLVVVRDKDDVEWDRPPGAHPSSYQEVNYLNLDFDDLAGQFSPSSVQTNRSLNETVGGMNLIAQNANVVGEFFLLMFINTFVEPVLSQLVMLEQYYEDDATLLAIAGKKAQLFERFGIDHITDELLESQVSLRVNVQLGSSDPVAKLARFKATFDIAAPMLAAAQEKGLVEVKWDEAINEVFTLGGQRSGSHRFVKVLNQEDKSVPREKVEELVKAMEEMAEKVKELESGAQLKLAIEKMRLDDREKDRQAKFGIDRAELQADAAMHSSDQQHDVRMAVLQHTLSVPPAPYTPYPGF
jgi:hypothetical protein